MSSFIVVVKVSREESAEVCTVLVLNCETRAFAQQRAISFLLSQGMANNNEIVWASANPVVFHEKYQTLLLGVGG